ncbi:MAG: radical SAM protein [Nanoarchaeota archaeon]
MIIDEGAIREQVKEGKRSHDVERVLAQAEEGNGLTATETSTLLQNLDCGRLEHAVHVATKIKSASKGNVAALFTCLYITNSCENDCGYCGYRESNSDLIRITLTSDEISEEARVIQDGGVSNAILVGGTIREERYKQLIIDGTKQVRDAGLHPWIEFENLSPDTLREIHAAGADNFILFQETYDRQRYARLHGRNSIKRDYDVRLQKIDEAIDAGFSNVGIGALFGLNGNDVFEVLGLYHHAQYLKDKRVGVCISAPTLKPAPGLTISHQRMSDEEVIKIYTVLRLALPNVSLALSGREKIDLRNRLFPIVDQIGSGGIPNPGGRTSHQEEYRKGDAQFRLFDTRSPQEVTQYLLGRGIEVRCQVDWGS